MRVRWNRIAALALSILASLFLTLLWSPIVTFTSSMTSIVEPHATPEEHLQGMMAFALVVVSVLGVIRLMINSNRNGS